MQHTEFFLSAKVAAKSKFKITYISMSGHTWVQFTTFLSNIIKMIYYYYYYYYKWKQSFISMIGI